MPLSLQAIIMPTGAPIASYVTVTHDQKESRWTFAPLKKSFVVKEADGTSFDLFEQVNEHWKTLPTSTLDKLGDLYGRMRVAFEEGRTLSDLTRQLQPLLSNFYEIYRLEDIYHWIRFHSNLIMPPVSSVKEKYEDFQNNNFPPEKTYLQEDYVWLLALTIALRPMLPIWGEFLERAKNHVNDDLKEYYTLRLLDTSNLMQSAPMKKLLEYVRSFVPAEKNRASVILAALPSDEIAPWLLSMTVIRRLSVGDIRGLNPSSHLISFIHGYIKDKANGEDNRFMGSVRDKKPDGGPDNENKISVLESYKIKQAVAAGDIVAMTWRAQDLDFMSTAVNEHAPTRMIPSLRKRIRGYEDDRYVLHECQITIVQWIMARAVSPRGLPYMRKMQLLDMMAVATNLLLYRGHVEIAGLMSALPLENTGDIQWSGTDGRKRILPALVEQLDQYYPHQRRDTSRQKSPKILVNVAIAAINEMDRELSKNEWLLTLPEQYLEQLTGPARGRRYATPPDIKNKLATLAISLASRTFHEPV